MNNGTGFSYEGYGDSKPLKVMVDLVVANVFRLEHFAIIHSHFLKPLAPRY
jgi:hypothetical protein